jgi:hypothetical protein
MEQTERPRVSEYIFAEPRIFMLLYVLTLCSAPVAIYLSTGRDWYRLITPFVLALSYKIISERRRAMALVATMHHFANDYDEASRRAIAKLQREDERRWRLTFTPFAEMFALPVKLHGWLLFLCTRLVHYSAVLLVVLHSIIGAINYTELLCGLFMLFAFNAVVFQLSMKVAWERALKRWTREYLAAIEANIGRKAKILALTKLQDTDLPAWVESKIVGIYRSGVNPDTIALKSDDAN